MTPLVQGGGNMYREKLSKLEVVILKKNNQFAINHLDYIQKVIDKTVSFVEVVVKYQARVDSLKNTYCDKDISIAIKELELQKDIKINTVESLLGIVNRLCVYYEQPLFYEGTFSKASITDYAFDLVNEFSAEE